MSFKIETVDYKSENAGYNFANSLHKTGFAILKNHPLDFDLIKVVYSEWESFFNSQEKLDYTFNPKTQDGYFPFMSENAKGFPDKDLKEFFHFYEWGLFPSNISKKTVMLYHQLMAIARELLVWIDANSPNKVKSSFSKPLFNMITDSTMNLMRIIHYPPLQNDAGNSIRAAAHGDINLITLLVAGSQPGLQVLNMENEWIDVNCNPGWLVINTGDMLQECSQGYYPSTIHRVINPKSDSDNKSRYSLPLFIHPKNEIKLSDKYTAKSFLDERLYEIGLKE
ncbi:MAG: isopenicillin N synthase family oxygenase [Candidatus Marinimicrobia bacterium]|jgi:isopenicillin N synthase-like dioxygenase|nr:isopenicillin N synthase family oxygenase [Candidatus Neomarinimicrobiota bacterium]